MNEATSSSSRANGQGSSNWATKLPLEIWDIAVTELGPLDYYNIVVETRRIWKDCQYQYDSFDSGYPLFRAAVCGTELESHRDRTIIRTPRWPAQWKQTFRGYTVLQVAAACGNVDMLGHILTHTDPDVDMDPNIRCGRCRVNNINCNLSRGELRRPLLHLAICYDKYEAAKLILEHARVANPKHLQLCPPGKWLMKMSEVVGETIRDNTVMNYQWELGKKDRTQSIPFLQWLNRWTTTHNIDFVSSPSTSSTGSPPWS